MPAKRRKIIFVVNNVAFFVSHRLPLALEAQNKGYQVFLCTGHAGSKLLETSALKDLKETKIKHHLLAFRSGFNPIMELWGLIQLFTFVWRVKPDVMHCASPKGNLYGGLVAKLVNVPSLVLAISGMGYAFTADEKGQVSFVRLVIKKSYTVVAKFAFSHKNKMVIVQNSDDKNELIANLAILQDEIILIPGSGVKLSEFQNICQNEKEKWIVFPARMLIDKGICEFVEAARQLSNKGYQSWRFILAGTADYKNPSAISVSAIEEWVEEGFIEWYGHVEDMPALLVKTSIVCLPSYREGMPKSLLEAAAAGCAVVTTDTIGCREAIIPDGTGELVPVRDSKALVQTLKKLINNSVVRERYGQASRHLAIEKFDLKEVVKQVMSIYENLEETASVVDHV